jgi:hypothetical protein
MCVWVGVGVLGKNVKGNGFFLIIDEFEIQGQQQCERSKGLPSVHIS